MPLWPCHTLSIAESYKSCARGVQRGEGACKVRATCKKRRGHSKTPPPQPPPPPQTPTKKKPELEYRLIYEMQIK
jgi:hypothetical protein